MRVRVRVAAGVAGTSIGLLGADHKLEHYVNILKSNGALLFAAKFFVTGVWAGARWMDGLMSVTGMPTLPQAPVCVSHSPRSPCVLVCLPVAVRCVRVCPDGMGSPCGLPLHRRPSSLGTCVAGCCPHTHTHGRCPRHLRTPARAPPHFPTSHTHALMQSYPLLTHTHTPPCSRPRSSVAADAVTPHVSCPRPHTCTRPCRRSRPRPRRRSRPRPRLPVVFALQGWDHLIGHTPEQVAKSGKAMVGITLAVSLVAAAITIEDE